MVALVGAALHSSISDWSSGELKTSNFDGAFAQDVYAVHIMILDRLEDKHPDQFHTLMEGIFATVSRGTGLGKATLSAMQKEALAMLDF
ncbi:hypothetical protein C8R46DRAFT_1229539 [Mycena filopes]|nr:hypothetical protein C8R46DRAFT_1229539 [Mycena filopes]